MNNSSNLAAGVRSTNGGSGVTTTDYIDSSDFERSSATVDKARRWPEHARTGSESETPTSRRQIGQIKIRDDLGYDTGYGTSEIRHDGAANAWKSQDHKGVELKLGSSVSAVAGDTESQDSPEAAGSNGEDLATLRQPPQDNSARLPGERSRDLALPPTPELIVEKDCLLDSETETQVKNRDSSSRSVTPVQNSGLVRQQQSQDTITAGDNSGRSQADVSSVKVCHRCNTVKKQVCFVNGKLVVNSNSDSGQNRLQDQNFTNGIDFSTSLTTSGEGSSFITSDLETVWGADKEAHSNSVDDVAVEDTFSCNDESRTESTQPPDTKVVDENKQSGLCTLGSDPADVVRVNEVSEYIAHVTKRAIVQFRQESEDSEIDNVLESTPSEEPSLQSSEQRPAVSEVNINRADNTNDAQPLDIVHDEASQESDCAELGDDTPWEQQSDGPDQPDEARDEGIDSSGYSESDLDLRPPISAGSSGSEGLEILGPRYSVSDLGKQTEDGKNKDSARGDNKIPSYQSPTLRSKESGDETCVDGLSQEEIGVNKTETCSDEKSSYVEEEDTLGEGEKISLQSNGQGKSKDNLRYFNSDTRGDSQKVLHKQQSGQSSSERSRVSSTSSSKSLESLDSSLYVSDAREDDGQKACTQSEFSVVSGGADHTEARHSQSGQGRETDEDQTDIWREDKDNNDEFNRSRIQHSPVGDDGDYDDDDDDDDDEDGGAIKDEPPVTLKEHVAPSQTEMPERGNGMVGESCTTRVGRPKSSHPRHRGQQDTMQLSNNSSNNNNNTKGKNTSVSQNHRNKENNRPQKKTPTPLQANRSLSSKGGNSSRSQNSPNADRWSLNSDESNKVNHDVISLVSVANTPSVNPNSDSTETHQQPVNSSESPVSLSTTTSKVFITDSEDARTDDVYNGRHDVQLLNQEVKTDDVYNGRRDVQRVDDEEDDSTSLQLRNQIETEPSTCSPDTAISGLLHTDPAADTRNRYRHDCENLDQGYYGSQYENRIRHSSENRDRLERIAEAADRVSEMQSSLQEMFGEARSILTDYQSQIKTKPITEFAEDVPEFTRTFSSLSGAYKACESVTSGINHQLTDIRNITDDICGLLSHNFQSAGLEAWGEGTENSAGVYALKEEKEARMKIQEARIKAMAAETARAAVEVQTAKELIVQTEMEAMKAEVAAQNAQQEAEVAVKRAEEARKAAEEKKLAEEESKRKAAEKARQKAEAERRRREEEEMRIAEDAKRKGSSFEDEKKRVQEEKARLEAERKNPNNWPRYIYSVEPSDYDPGVGVILRSQEGTIHRDDVMVTLVDQLSDCLPLAESEELVSNILCLQQTDPDRQLKLDEPMAVAIPHCSPRLHAGREAVVKMMTSDGRVVTLPTTDVIFDDIKELRFVEVRIRRFGTLAVFLRLKKEILTFNRKGGKVMSSVDSRVTLTNQSGAFKSNVNFTLEVQPIDPGMVADLTVKRPTDCGRLLSCSPIITVQLPAQFCKPLTLTLPCPPHPAMRPRRPQTAANRLTRDPEPTDNRPLSARPSYGAREDFSDELHLLRKEKKGPWVKLEDVQLVQSKKKDVVTFDMTQPFTKLAVIRTQPQVSNLQAEKMMSHIVMTLTVKPISVIMRQKSAEPSHVTVTCTQNTNVDRITKALADEGYDHGPRPGPDIPLTEGQRLELKFRGNLELLDPDTRQHFAFNSHIPFRLNFRVSEQDKFAQKGFDSYRGFCQIFTTGKVKKPTENPDERDRATGQRLRDEWVDGDIMLSEQLVIIPKSDPETPRPLNLAPLTLTPEGVVTDELLKFLATHLQYSDWRKVAQVLNIKRSRIQAILRQNVSNDVTQTIHDLLVTWSKRLPRATDRTEILCHALITSGRADLAEEIQSRAEEFRTARAQSLRGVHLRKAFITVAKHPLAVVQWKQFARYLGVGDDELRHIEAGTDSIHQRCLGSLYKWQEQQGDKASVSLLATKLRSCRYGRLAREIENS